MMTYAPIGGSEVVGTGTPTNEYDAAIAEFAGGGYLVAWYADGLVLAQRYDSDGNPAGGQLTLGGIGDGEPFNMVATTLDNGNVVVTWGEFRDFYSAADINAQIIGPDGTLIGANILVENQANGYQNDPSISALPGGGFVVAWSDSLGDPDGAIRARLFDSGGVPTGVELAVNTSTAGSQLSSAVTALSGGGFVIVWTDLSGAAGDSSGSSIRAQLFAADGTPVGSEYLVNTTVASDQRDPSITALSDGGFLVCWTDLSATAGDPDGSAIRAQRYAADGTPVGGEFQVNDLTAGDQENAEVAALADGGFVVTWVHHDPSGDYDIAGRIYDADGNPTAGQFTVNADTGGNQFTPAVHGFDDGRFVVAWIDYGAGAAPGTSDIRVQTFAPVAAVDDTFTTNELNGVVGNLFADNGSGADLNPGAIVAVNGNPASVGTQITLASGALLTVNSNGSFAYDPNGAFQYTPTFSSGAFNTPSADFFSYTIAGGESAIVIFTINGIDNNDTVVGSEDNNRLIGGGGNDTVFGLGGVDYITGGFGDDSIFGDDGIDRAGWYQTNEALGGATVSLLLQGTPQYTGTQGWDTLFDIENLSGTPFADSLTGDDNDNWLWGSPATISVGVISTSNNDFLDGQGGNDLLVVGIGNHTVIGGDGTDTLRFTENGNPEPAIAVNLNLQGGAQDTGAGSWTLSGIENVSGGISDDTLIGDGNANVLAGSLGSDTINGGGGNDLLLGDDYFYVTAQGVIAIGSAPDTSGGNDQLNGGGGDDALYGGGGSDVLRGSIGNDELHGGSGNDLLIGGLGDDIIEGGDGYDRAGNYHLDESLGGVTIDLNLQGVAQNTGGQGWDTLTGIEYVSGTPWADTLIGDGNDNVLWGSMAIIDPSTNWVSTSNNDTLDGGAGNDLLYVGIGNHVLTGGSGTDTVGFIENWGDDPAITVSLALQGSAQDTGQGLWTLNGIENLSGGNDNDTLTGDGNANILAGHIGNDVLSGGAGNDSLYGDGSIDTGSPTSAPQTLFPDIGGNGNDTLEGGLGNDLIDGGGGVDTASYAHASGGVTVNLNSGTSSGADGNDTLINMENLRGSEFNDALTGNTGANVIEGLGGNDTINGHAGDDTIYGGDGNDFLLGDLSENNITVSGNDIIYGGAGNDTIRGGLGNDQLYGGDGNDLMRGNGGVDYFDGGANDPFSDTASGDRISFFDQRITQGVVADLRTGIIANDGYGNVEAMVNIESLGSGSAYADTFYGNDDRNYLAADVGDQVFGFGGDDSFQSTSAAAMVDGGSGYDRLFLFASGSFLLPDTNGDGLAEFAGPAASGYVVNLAAGTISDSYGNSGAVAGIEELWGSELGDTITGDAANNVLNGQDGNDIIEGGLGDDTIDGGAGTDTASYANASGGMEVFLYRLGTGDGESAGPDGFDLLTNIENLTGSAFNDQLGGNTLANVLSGGEGNDGLRGQGGDDTLLGGSGNDFLNGGAGNDIIDGGAGFDRAAFYEDAGPSGVTVDLNLQGVAQDTGQGMDTLIGIENVSGSIYGDHLTGDDGDNQLWGSSSTLLNGTIVTTNNDVLSGNGGNDLLVVGIGNHVVDGGTGTDTFRFTENGQPETGITLSLLLQGAAQASGNGNWTLTNIENLSGSVSGDVLTGDGNANVLAGDLGDDALNGGGGDDTLYGDGAINVDGPGSGQITTYPDVVATFGGVSGNDVLDGGDGNDQLYGGGGNDTASYASASGGIVAVLNDDGSGFGFGAAGSDQLHDMENLTGSAFNDTLAGNASANILNGGGGADIIVGRAGSDILHGGDGDDYLRGDDDTASDDILDGGNGWDRVVYNLAPTGVTIDLNVQGVAQDTGLGLDTFISIEHASGSTHEDTIIGNDGDNWLRSWGGNDIISGNGGNDLIETMPGNNIVDGGGGTDTWSFYGDGTFFAAGVNVSLALQGAAQDTGQGVMTATGFENLSGTIHADILSGDGGANVLAGDAGSDVLSGGGGNDVLYGDGGIFVDWHGDGGSGPITEFADITSVLGGVAGNDVLDGGAGDDQLYGGGGSDTATYASAGGSVSVFLYNGGFGEADGAAGYDQLHDIENVIGSAFNDILYGNNVDNIVTGGDGHDDVRGGAGNDQVFGNAGDDLLYGNGGDDLLDGGAGYDRVGYYSGATAGVTVNLNLQGVAQNTGQGWDTLVGIENVSGTQFGDTLTGDDNDNWLWGSASTVSPGNVVTTNNDTLSGGGGNDLMILGIGNHVVDGGSGIDTFRFSENGAPETGITLSLLLQGTAQASGNGNWTLTNIENLSGSIANDSLTGDGNANLLAGDLGNDTLSGGAGNDTLYGDGQIMWDGHGTGRSGPITTYVDATGNYVGGIAGNDTLEGGLGNDLLDGGGGIDTASYANAAGSVTVNLGSGTSSGADGNDTLANIENVIGSSFNDNLTGNGGTNALYGLGGADTVSGGSGDDTLYGGDGNDFLQGDLGENNITVAGNDILYGENGDDSLRGGLGNDQLFGGANNDLLRGNGGVDYFDGGADDGEGFNGIGDRVSFFEQRATQGVVADLRTGIISNDGFGNVETMVGIESLGAATAYVDTFYGNDGRNYLAADRGDFLYGFGGDDLFSISAAAAMVDGGTGIDRLSLFNGGGWLLPDTNGDGLAETAAAATAGWTVNLAAGTIVDGYGNVGSVTGIENVDGNVLNDTLIGDSNANVLNGGDGDDLIEGRAGNDTLDGGTAIDTASYANATGSVTVNLLSGTATGADGNDTLANFENLVGSAFNDTLVGSNSANVIDGGGGIDTIAAFAGDDTLNGGAGSDSLYGMQGNDTLNGGDGNDNLRGGTGDDVIDGGSGFNIAGYFPTLTDTVASGVTVDLNIQGVAQNTGQGSDTLINIQGLVGTQFADTLIGDGNTNLFIIAGEGAGAPGGADQVFGNGGDDLLIVGSGNVLLDGGSGNDTVSFNAAGGTLLNGVTVSLALQGGAQTTGSGSMTLVGIEHLSGTGLADALTGDSGNNDLSGAGGDDVLVGGAGNDNLRGDAVFTAFSPTDGTILAPYLAGDATVFTGQVAGNDTLEGGLGNDFLDGGAGTDTATYLNAAGSVTVNLASGTATGADGSDTLVNIENATGGAFNDTLSGNGSANTLSGGGGHDSLSGAGGNDTLQGGNGNDSLTGGAGDDLIDGGAGFDRASYNVGATAGVTVNLSLTGAQNTGQGFDTLVNVENVVGTTFNDVLTGNSGNNWLWGGSLGTGVTGNDTISGGDGNDLVEVGTGNHTLSGGNGNDTLTFWAGGTDVTSTGVAFNLATTGAQNTRQGTTSANGFENLSGSRYGDTFTGDGNNNILAGNTGNDTLSGGAGIDALYGDGGFTTFTAGGLATGPIRLVADITTEFGGVAGDDILNGGDGDDFLYGGGGNDTLKGDRDNDTLYGGTGNDTLVGGQGNDRYVIEANSGADTISGFAHVDNIVFAASSGVTSFSQLTLTKVGGTSTLVTWGNGNSILIDMRPSDLTAADFSFESASVSLSSIGLPPGSPDYFFG